MTATCHTRAEIVLGQSFACGSAVAAAIVAKARMHDYPPRTVIVKSERAHEHVHVLIHGQARMFALSFDGRLVAIEDYLSGDLLGETGLFEPDAPRHDIAAVIPSSAASFTNAVFLEIMANYHCVALAVSRRLVERLARITRRMVEGATLSANGRIHAELLRQAKASQDLTIRPAPVLSQFALAVQSTRETVSRAINALEKRGVIERNEHQLRVIAPHRLEEMIF